MTTVPPDSEVFRIEWSTADESQEAGDGGFSTAEHIIATRERLSRVEADVKTVKSATTRIEEKVNELADETERVENQSMSKERFDRDYADELETTMKMATIIQWVVAAVVLIVGIIGTLVKIGAISV